MNILKNKSLKGHIFATFVVICWGTSFIVSKSLISYMTPVQLACTRFVFAYLALWIIQPKWHFSWKKEAWFLLLSVFSNTLYFLAENTALQFTQSSNVSILTSTIPLVTAVLLRIFKKKKMKRGQIAGLVVAFVGVVLVIMNGVFILKLGGLGDVLAISAAVSWSCYSLLISDKVGNYDAFLISRKLMLYGFLTTLPVAFAEGADIDFAVMFGGGRILGVLYLSLVCSALCYALWNKAISEIGIVSANTYLYGMPLITLVAGMIFLGEKLTFMGATGMLIVIAGMLVTNKKG